MHLITRRRFNSTATLMPLVLGSLSTHLVAQQSQRPRQKIRVGQIGTKHAHAVGKLQTVRKLSDHFEVVGIVESDSKQREKVQQTEAFRGLQWLTTEQLLNRPGLQLVLVETEIDQLLSTAERCLAAGMHIHLDKPAGASLKDFEKITKLAAEQHCLIQMGYMFRSNPAFKFLIQAVKQGWLGEIFEIHGVISKQIAPHERAELAKYRGGSMFELGCHLIDAVVKLLGKPTQVTALNRNTYPDLDQLNDNCLAVFQYPKATATVRSSVLEVEGGRRRQFCVCGTQGTIEIEPLEPPHLTLTLDRPQGGFRKGPQVVELPKSGGRYDGDLIDFAAAIRGELEYDYSLEHDLTVQVCVLQASEMV
ncbi:MAG: Gfo/Idh/MocA family oxidoreductase [Pirellulaceae bacterium]|nr:Gfo/Idh/MocA family oxidoreductase [Pirellulaceae bacterium]